MKVFFALAFAAVALVVVSAKSCKDSDECDDGQCCVGFTPFRGSCKKLSAEGKKCLADERVFPFNEIYIVSCPCADGLECIPKEKDGKVKNDGTCQVPPTEAPTEEPTTGGDSGETTGDAGNSGETTGDSGNSGETTGESGNSGETIDVGDETTKEASTEVTDEPNNEATEGGSSQEVQTAVVEESRRRR